MNHPYAPFIIAALSSASLACLIFIWLCIRRDRREQDQHRWEQSTRDLPDIEAEHRALLAQEGDQNR